jgi:NTE family protein
MAKTKTSKPKTINLALQGGGSHGAFTWGVLDAFLDDGRIQVEGISGTSAGAMNAAAYAFGWEQGGAAPAKRMLEAFWAKVSEKGAAGIGVPEPVGQWLHGGPDSWNLDMNPLYVGFDVMTRFLSPYQFNPLALDPVKTVVEEVIDFSGLNACRRTKLYVSATNVRTGKIKVFETHEITPDVLLASACLPYIFRAVEIDGEAYWDGGYMGNPAIYPLIYGCDSPDVLVVQINPIERPDVPTSARDIQNRMTEISFNSSLLREMRAIGFVTKLLDQHKVDLEGYKRLNMHLIAAPAEMAAFNTSSKFNTDKRFLAHLRDLGRTAGEQWLADHFDKIGVESSIDLEAMFG